MNKEQTFGMIKPTAVKKHQIGKILSMIEENGLEIVELKKLTMTPTQAREFYKEHQDKPFYESLVGSITSGAIVAYVLSGDNAIENYRKLMGATDPKKAVPRTLRALFGVSIEENAVHGSDSPLSAQREIKFFFA